MTGEQTRDLHRPGLEARAAGHAPQTRERVLRALRSAASTIPIGDRLVARRVALDGVRVWMIDARDMP